MYGFFFHSYRTKILETSYKTSFTLVSKSSASPQDRIWAFCGAVYPISPTRIQKYGTYKQDFIRYLKQNIAISDPFFMTLIAAQ